MSERGRLAHSRSYACAIPDAGEPPALLIRALTLLLVSLDVHRNAVEEMHGKGQSPAGGGSRNS